MQTEKYYKIYLNNNIYRELADNGVFSNKTIEDEESKFKTKKNIRLPHEDKYATLDKVTILGYEDNGKIYDFITKDEIAYSLAPLYCDYITYNDKERLNAIEVETELKKIISVKSNIKNYKERFETIKDITHQRYLETQKENKKQNNNLKLSRKYLKDYLNK